jgi:uridine phosphorylase
VDDRCPYRETRTQVRRWSAAGALAVEMQAASRVCAKAKSDAAIGVVAMVSNSGDHTGEQFDTGEHSYRVAVLDGIIAGAVRVIRARPSQTSRRTATKAKR